MSAPFAPAPFAAALSPARPPAPRPALVRALRMATVERVTRIAAAAAGFDRAELLEASPWPDLDALAAEAGRAVPADIDCASPEGRALADVYDAAMSALNARHRAVRIAPAPQPEDAG